MPVGFGDEGGYGGRGVGRGGRGKEVKRLWTQGIGKEGKKQGFVFILTHMVTILTKGKPLWGGRCQRVEVEQIDIRPGGGRGSPDDTDNPDIWEKEIRVAGVGGAFIYSDGSLLEGENVGGGPLSWGALEQMRKRNMALPWCVRVR